MPLPFAQQQYLDLRVSGAPHESAFAHFYGYGGGREASEASSKRQDWAWFSIVQHDPRKVEPVEPVDTVESSRPAFGLHPARGLHPAFGLHPARGLHHTRQHSASGGHHRASPGRKVRQQSYPLHMLPEVISAIDPQLNSYISQSEFTRPNRRIVHLWRLGVIWLDMDTYKTDWGQGRSLDDQVRDLLWILEDKGYPEPSLIMSSGRGLYVKWFHEGLPRAALPRWNAVMRQITREMLEWGSDMGAKDASRVLRIAGTINSKSGEIARVLHVTPDEQGLPIRYDFNLLAEYILPLSREQIRENRQAAIARQEAYQKRQAAFGQGARTHQDYPNLRPFSAQQLAWDRVEDLRKLVQIRQKSGVGMEGARELMLFWQMNHLLISQQVNLQNFWQESHSLACEIDPRWAISEGRHTLGTLYAKAKAQRNGEKIEYNGKKWSPLYTPKNQTLIDVFRIRPEEERQMKTIVSESMARERARERDRVRKASLRRETGMKARGTEEQRMQAAALVKDQGLSYRKAAKEMGVSHETIRTWLA